MKEFPNDPSKRRIIVVLRGCDYDVCSHTPEGSKLLLDTEVHLVDGGAVGENLAHPVLVRLANERLLKPGAVLVQSPFCDDEYAEIGEAMEAFAFRKHLLFSSLCRHLGAVEVQIEAVSGKRRRSVIGGSGALGAANCAVQGQSEQQAEESLRNRIGLRDKFDGGQANIHEARRFLEEFRLTGDTALRALVDAREGTENRLRERRLEVNLSREAMSHLYVAGRIQVPQGFSLDARFARSVHEVQEYAETVTVIFS